MQILMIALKGIGNIADLILGIDPIEEKIHEARYEAQLQVLSH